MQSYPILFIISSLAFAIPFLGGDDRPTPAIAFTSWDTHYEGRKLRRLDLNQRERKFYENFKGSIAKFTDGNREIIFKKIAEPTRKLHPSLDCFKAVGYSIKFLQSDDLNWQVFEAKKAEVRLRIKESIFDRNNNSWNNVSAWYWSALLRRTKGPWTSITIVERL